MNNYKALKIDMDYCADPIWVAEEGYAGFANGSLAEFEDVLPKSLLHSLAVYQRLWESSHWSKYMSPSDEGWEEWKDRELISEATQALQRSLAKQVKACLPAMKVVISIYDEEHETWRLEEIK